MSPPHFDAVSDRPPPPWGKGRPGQESLSRCCAGAIWMLAALAAATSACAADRDPGTQATGETGATTRVLVLGGLSLDAQGAYARNMRDWMNRFVALMRKQQVPVANITVLGETPTNAQPPVLESTLINVRAAFEKLSRDLRPRDQFVLFMVGYGATTEPVAKFCLPGPDLNGNELARMLDELATTNLVVINCASGGAEFLESYARPGRVVLSAAGRTGQGAETVFAEFLLFGYESGKADLNGDGRITILEAFNWAARECVDWYRRQLPGVAVTGRESCRIFQKLYQGSRLTYDAANSKPDAPDGLPDVKPAYRAHDLLYKMPENRLPCEMPSLEDMGVSSNAVTVEVRTNPLLRVVISGQPGEEGAAAARTILGRPPL